MSSGQAERQQYLPTKTKGFKGSLVLREAVSDGIQGGLAATAATALTTGALHFSSAAYRSKVNIGASAAIVGCVGIASTLGIAESRLEHYHGRPDLYHRPKSQRGTLNRLTTRWAETMVEKPLQVVAAIGIPSVGLVAFRMFQDRGISTSRKVMHTRVVGQTAILGIVLSIMATQNWSSHARRRLRELDAKAADGASAEQAE